jgi:hypothetical protein
MNLSNDRGLRSASLPATGQIDLRNACRFLTPCMIMDSFAIHLPGADRRHLANSEIWQMLDYYLTPLFDLHQLDLRTFPYYYKQF